MASHTSEMNWKPLDTREFFKCQFYLIPDRFKTVFAEPGFSLDEEMSKGVDFDGAVSICGEKKK